MITASGHTIQMGECASIQGIVLSLECSCRALFARETYPVGSDLGAGRSEVLAKGWEAAQRHLSELQTKALP